MMSIVVTLCPVFTVSGCSMKKNIYLGIAFLFFFNFSFSQNLVPNPSFEDYTTCVTGVAQVYKSTGWHAYLATPDYFNSCADSSSLFSVPYNGFGYQYPRTGNGYCGFYTYGNPAGNPNYREIIGAQLATTLVIGTRYYISLYVNTTYGVYFPTRFATNKIGALFSTAAFDSSASPAPINNFAHIYTDSVITDTMNWYRISQSFIADSAYGFISIGNFFNAANTDTVILGPSGTAAYYFIDDVCVSTDSLSCTGGIGITENNHVLFNIYPNPATDIIHVKTNSLYPFEITIYSLWGELILNRFINDSEGIIEISNYPRGMYVAIIKQDGNRTQQKFIKY
jgi:hypothetical protein